MTSKFSMCDEADHERVFIVGDACHTHSPKAGQGMNVSMMDSYNLAWKLAHTVHGLSPNRPNGSVLTTYNSERLGISWMLIDFDSKFSSLFSGQMEFEGAAKELTHEQFLKVFSDGSGYTSGCGIENSPSTAIQDTSAQSSSPIIASDCLQGTLRPGRRLLDSVVRRYADANLRHLQDGMLLLKCQLTSSFWNRHVNRWTCLDVNALAYRQQWREHWPGRADHMPAYPHRCEAFQMSLQKKVGVAIMFDLGGLETVISAIRLHALLIFESSIDPSWDHVLVIVWTALELGITIIASCLRALRFLFLSLVAEGLTFSALLASGALSDRYGKSNANSVAWTGKSGFVEIEDVDEVGRERAGRREKNARAHDPDEDH